MKVTILQRDIIWGNPQANLARTDEALASLPDADLFVLPEMFATGFCTKPEEMPEANDSDILPWMKRKAAERQCAIAGSVAVRQEGGYRNRFYFVCPDGTVHHYDKRHLFAYGGEHKQFTAGTERVIVDFRGVRILPAICYDLRFPVWTRNRGDYDMILYVANWPISRMEAWNTLLRARAIENQCYVAGVNRVGSDPYCAYSGGSVILDSYGRTLAECAREAESCASAEVDLKALVQFRKKFPVLEDADEFEWKG